MTFTQNFKTLLRSNYIDDEDFDMDDIIIHDTSIEIKDDKLQYLLFDFEKRFHQQNMKEYLKQSN